MLNRRRVLAACGVWLLGVTSVLAADETPSVGLLYNTKETHSLVYRCQQDRDATLDCEFIQTAIRKKAKPEELASKLEQARKEFRGGIKWSADECKSYSQMVDVLEGRKKPPKEEGLKEMTDKQKKDALAFGKALSDFCRSGTEESYLKIASLAHDKDTRTCKVGSNPFKQTFKFVQDFVSGSDSWVTQGTPEGPCGIVQLCRFESERTKDSKLVFWKYIARKAITNPKGSLLLPGVSCKDLDEGEYLYDWRAKEHSLGCDYIEFSAF